MKWVSAVAAVCTLLGGWTNVCSAQIDLPAVDGNGRAIVVANTSPQVRGIGANYFDSLRQSQVWMNLQPEAPRPDPPPFILNLTVTFPGTLLNHAPESVRVRAEAFCSAYPTHIRQPILGFRTPTMAVDLTGGGSPYQFIATCSQKGPLDTVIADVPFDELRKLIQAMDVSVDALGFSVRLSAADLAAWRGYLHTVEKGVTVRTR